MIRRHKTTIFADAKETTTVYEVKKIVEGILKRAPEEQRLYKVTSSAVGGKDMTSILMDDARTLADYGYTHTTARAQLPETIGLAFRTSADKDEYEPLEITPVSTPPELPDVMKSETTTAAAGGGGGGGSAGTTGANMDANDKWDRKLTHIHIYTRTHVHS